MIESSNITEKNYPGKCFWTKESETPVKFNHELSANRPSNNWALQFLFFLLCIGFYKITIIITLLLLERQSEKRKSCSVLTQRFRSSNLTSLCFCEICPQRKTKPIYSSESNVINLVCSRLVTESLTGSSWPIKSFKNVLLPTPLLPTTATVKKWFDIEWKRCNQKQKWCDLEHEWCDLEQKIVWFVNKSHCWEQIRL